MFRHCILALKHLLHCAVAHSVRIGVIHLDQPACFARNKWILIIHTSIPSLGMFLLIVYSCTDKLLREYWGMVFGVEGEGTFYGFNNRSEFTRKVDECHTNHI
jgi:hypothetical protein